MVDIFNWSKSRVRVAKIERDSNMDCLFWKNKNVFLTGHSGFKGGWLSLWLSEMGANVTGFSLLPEGENNFYMSAGISERTVNNIFGDIRDLEGLKKAFKTASPDIVMHLAAQPLVSDSYSDPLKTYSTNVMGTVNVLEAVKSSANTKAVLVVTSDKCYHNREWLWSYREDEPLGGHDPYSSSKACAELVVNAYEKSFLKSAGISVATARAGNVIGGGDWSKNRLLPDILDSREKGKRVMIRSPNSTRPWQHVLDPLNGYLSLSKNLFKQENDCSGPWNFGPEERDAKSVRYILEKLKSFDENVEWEIDGAGQFHEANFLMVSSQKSKALLNWFPRWSIDDALKHTLDWHDAFLSGVTMQNFSLKQIADFEA